ncbi:MAG: ABC transporter ATP-binding protein [Spirochaetia bacterium]|nr:ABC transporter ATP-binding protein [Spirochaetia bacterium]
MQSVERRNPAALEPAVAVRAVRRRFRDLTAVDGVTLTLAQGESAALLGPNGAGKTTLVEMIEGIQRPDEGEIRVFGQTWDKDARDLRRSVGLSLQESRFVDKVTVRETIQLFASFHGVDNVRCSEVLESVRLIEKEKTYVADLSGGQRQRLALGISILHRPRLLLLDEPTTGLDPHARREIWEILRQLQETGTTLLLTTHYMEEAEVLCPRVIIMYSGRILADGKLEDLLKMQGEGEIIEYRSSRTPDEKSLMKVRGVKSVQYSPETMRVRLIVKKMSTALPHFLRHAEREKLKLDELECRRMTLDDLFISMTGRHLND